MPIRTFTDAELHRVGSLKWTGMTRKDGSPTIGAWVAEMDFGTAPSVAKAMTDCINDGLLGYQPSWLAPKLAEATASFQKRRFGWDLRPDQVRLVTSVLPALELTMTKLMRPGTPVIVPTPAYMPFLSMPTEAGHPVIEVPSLHGDTAGGKGWALDLEGIKTGLEAGAGLVILCNPWNPTGRVFDEAELRALGELVSQYDALVFSDEIHSPLVLDEVPFLSYARLDPRFAAHTVTATAASKGGNIAGLPSAQVILPDEALRARWDEQGQKLHVHASTIGTVGTIEAYENGVEWLDEVRDYIRLNVDALEAAIAHSPIDFVRPQGTYLSWLGFAGLGLNPSPAIALREQAGIAVNDGKTLGADYADWARFNLACSHETIAEMIDRVLALVAGARLG